MSLNNGKIVFENNLYNKSVKHTFSNIGFTIGNLSNVDFKNNSLQFSDTTGIISLVSNFAINDSSDFKIKFALQPITNNFNGSIDISNSMLKVLQPYIKEFLDITIIDGYSYHSLTLSGNLNDKSLLVKGTNKISNLKIIENKRKKQFASLKNLVLNIKEYNLKKNAIYISEMKLENPNLLFELYNQRHIFSDIILSKNISGKTDSQKSCENTAKSTKFNWSIGSCTLLNGAVLFNDFTMTPKFNYKIENIKFKIENLSNTKNNKGNIDLYALINRAGKVNATSIIDNNKSNIKIDVADVSLIDFTPYSKKYIAYPVSSGALFVNSAIHINENKLLSENIFKIENIDVGEKEKNFQGKELPIKLALAILRDNKKNIKLDIPVEGNLDDPKFRISRVIFYAIKNVIIKAATNPFNLLAKLVDGKEEDFKEINYTFLQTALDKEQLKKIEGFIKILEERQGIILELIHYTDIDEEREQLAVKLSKEKYYREKNNFSDTYILSDTDNIAVADVNESDTNFSNFILKKLEMSGRQIKQDFIENCFEYIGKREIQNNLDLLINTRLDNLKQAFIIRNKEYENRVIISNADLTNIIVADKRCHFKINVKTE